MPKNQSRKKKEILKLNENENTAKRLEHGEGSSTRGIYSMKFHTLKKNQKEQQINVLMTQLKMLKIKANQI